MALQVRSEALTRLIDPAVEPTLLGGRFEFSEGPVWSARGESPLLPRHSR